MIRIAMVEDEEEYAKTIRRYCSRYSAEKHADIELVWHDNPVAFLEGYRGDCDVVFMDVVMPLMDGMTCARRLREKDGSVLLCFITSMAQYAIHGYEVGALDYVVKPIAYEEFAMKMDRLVRLLERQGAKTRLMPPDRGLRSRLWRSLHPRLCSFAPCGARAGTPARPHSGRLARSLLDSPPDCLA